MCSANSYLLSRNLNVSLPCAPKSHFHHKKVALYLFYGPLTYEHFFSFLFRFWLSFSFGSLLIRFSLDVRVSKLIFVLQNAFTKVRSLKSWRFFFLIWLISLYTNIPAHLVCIFISSVLVGLAGGMVNWFAQINIMSCSTSFMVFIVVLVICILFLVAYSVRNWE